MVGGAGLILAGRADEGAVFYAGDVAWVRAREKAIGPLAVAQPLECASINQQLAEPCIFLSRAVAPKDFGWLGQGSHFGHPSDQPRVFDVSGWVEINPLHHG